MSGGARQAAGAGRWAAASIARMGEVERRIFRVALVVACVLHAAAMVWLMVGMKREKPPVRWIEMLPESALAGGGAVKAAAQIGSSRPEVVRPPPEPRPQTAPPKPAVSKAVVAQPVMPKAVVAQPAVPKPVVAQPAMPKPVVAQPAMPKPDPRPQVRKDQPKTVVAPTVRAQTPAPAPPKKKEIAVNMEEVTRSSAAPDSSRAPAPVVAAVAPVREPAMDAAEVREQLVKRLGKTGVQGAGSGASGPVPSEVAGYYSLIRDVYYGAWRQPGVPGRESMAAVVRVRLGADGRVISSAIERSSGDSTMDSSVQAALGVVTSIGRPLPEALGSQFAEVTITFEF